MNKLILVWCVVVLMLSPVLAQEEINPNSVDPIPASEHLYKIRVWRDVDMREKINQGFFSNNGEISRLFLDGVRSGELDSIFTYDSLQFAQNTKQMLFTRTDLDNALSQGGGFSRNPWDSSMTKSYYASNADTVFYKGKFYSVTSDIIPPTEGDLASKSDYEIKQLAATYGVKLTGKYNRAAAIRNIVASYVSVSPDKDQSHWLELQGGNTQYYGVKEIKKFRIMEDLIFDRRRSRLYHDIQAIQFFMVDPQTGQERNLGWVRYKDLVKVINAHPKQALWFNRENPAQHKSFADAFKLRLFKSVLWKVENPEDSFITEIMTNNGRSYKEAVLALEWEEMRLMEKEHNLWEY